MTYSVSGSYFESCNCDPICPCRMSDGIPGGRSTYGECLGALSWLLEEGRGGGGGGNGLLPRAPRLRAVGARRGGGAAVAVDDRAPRRCTRGRRPAHRSRRRLPRQA